MTIYNKTNKPLEKGASVEHHFNIYIAKEVGILEAVLLQHIYFWVEHNKANEKAYFDGDYWTFNSIKAFEELFPYATGNQIRRALEKLKDCGLIKTGNYNKSAYDRTLWYALTEKAFSIFKNEKIDLAENKNGNDENAKPIPYNKNIYKTHIENKYSKGEIAKRFTPPTLEEVKTYCLERKNNVDCEQFVDFYESKGWVVGKNKMKDWKAAIRTWERRDEKNKATAVVENKNETQNSRWVFEKWEQYLGFLPEKTTANIDACENLIDLDGTDGVEKLIVALRMRSEHGFLSKEIKNVSSPSDLWEKRETIWMFYNRNYKQWANWVENAKQGKKKWEI